MISNCASFETIDGVVSMSYFIVLRATESPAVVFTIDIIT